MFKIFIKYLKIAWIIYSVRVSKQFEAPADNFLRIMGTACYLVMNTITIVFILNNYSFREWSNKEFWIFFFNFLFFYYSAFSLLWQGLKLTAFDISRGTFDFILMRPINARFLAFTRPGTINNIVTAIFGFLGLIISLIGFGYAANLVLLPLYLILIMLSLWSTHCFSLIVLSLVFKYEGMEHLRATIFAIQEVYKFPVTAYENKTFLVKILIVPFSLMTTIPAMLILLKKINPLYILIYLFVALALTFIAKRVWNWGLRNYTSAS